jgi:ring-1,2-phenylacetyl-CoA epoxidase subunit PaaD
MATRPDLATLWRALDGVLDPEVPALSVVELGIVRELRWVTESGNAPMGDTGANEIAEVTLTPTYSGCPATEVIADAVRTALLAAGAARVQVHQRHAPAWTSDWIGPAAREKLRAYGIAPPAHLVGDDDARDPAGVARPLRFHARGIACPRCGSLQAERLSAFGATACKALYRCLACREPFEYFKPI